MFCLSQKESHFAQFTLVFRIDFFSYMICGPVQFFPVIVGGMDVPLLLLFQAFCKVYWQHRRMLAPGRLKDTRRPMLFVNC